MNAPELVMYTTQCCGDCLFAKRLLPTGIDVLRAAC
jgi:hypothetical protein